MPSMPKDVCERSHTIVSNGESRSYLTALPLAYCSKGALAMEPIPAVFALHGLGAPPGMFNLVFAEYVAEMGFVLVQPLGSGRPASFNGVHCCGSAVKRGVDDVKFLVDIVRHLATWLPVDAARGVVGTGFSNGAFLLEHAARVRGTLFKAIVPVGGHLYTNLTGRRNLPIMLGHALADGSVKYGGCCGASRESRCCCGISDRSPPTCLPADAVFDQWLHSNGCTGKVQGAAVVANKAPGGKLGVPPVSATCWEGSNCEARTVFCAYDNFGHTYPGRRLDLPMPSNSDPKEILLFLLGLSVKAVVAVDG
eukprot:CAMPEP_0172606936 /NCGR_PEP_ID=MMETSP1068-20121228/27148_1 /TAXON_ID=35684 /ORGANISM="Pseudopedinella elastica, Strain CCMP716" /LENGTH=308 /DNA_ID=CAMNT_0013409817 /DNA_START=158 /DNA_END=1085 /DNA_ORIENTATION=+